MTFSPRKPEVLSCLARQASGIRPAVHRKPADDKLPPGSAAKRPERCPHLRGEKLGLLPRGEVPAPVGLVEVREGGVGLLDALGALAGFAFGPDPARQPPPSPAPGGELFVRPAPGQ
jgi:hypothetical protein